MSDASRPPDRNQARIRRTTGTGHGGDVDAELPLARLLDSESFKEVCASFAALFGIGLRVFDGAGKKLVDVSASTADHCGYLFGVHPTRVSCTKLVNEIRTCALSTTANTERNCFSGLRYNIFPIVHEGTILGRVIFGPYAPEGLTAPPSGLKMYAPEGLVMEHLAELLAQIPRAGEAAVKTVLENISSVLDVIIHSNYKTHLTSQMHIASMTAAFDDLERTNQELKEANAQLQDLDQLKSNFVATVSHELRTPLTSVIGYSEMLLEGMAGEINQEQRSYVETILEKGESLLGLIGQVLDLSRIESGNSEMQRQASDVGQLIELSLSDVLPQAQSRGLTMRQEVAEGLLPIAVDADKIRRVITNLLGNAVKFTQPEGEVTISVNFGEAKPPGADQFDIFEPERNQYLRIDVKDSGIGIPASKLNQVFESFYQVDNTSTREFGGSGLGLSIARNFIRAHDGWLDVESEEGVGSTFTVWLPYHVDPPALEGGLHDIPERT